MDGHVAADRVGGVAWVAAVGDDVEVGVAGCRTRGGAPVQRDSIFRIASMTKPIVAVGALLLVEECKLRLEDPVDELLPELARSGCLFVVSAFESLNDAILERLDKGHTAADAGRAVRLLREHGIDVRPSFLPFTPWTSMMVFSFLNSRLTSFQGARMGSTLSTPGRAVNG